MSEHEHRFEKYAGIPVFGELATFAWVPLRHVTGDLDNVPKMWRCECGQQGYEVPI